MTHTLTHTGKGLYGTNGTKSAAGLILLEQKWPESVENQGMEGSQPVGKDEVGSSNLPSSSKTKGHPKGCPFVLESDRRRRPPVMPGVKIAYSEGESIKNLDTTD